MSKRGFAMMDPALVKQIASRGGKAAHAAGTAHEFKAGEEKAIAAGRKGGVECHRRRKARSAVDDAPTVPAPPPEGVDSNG
jgi:general stress protein YciG